MFSFVFNQKYIDGAIRIDEMLLWLIRHISITPLNWQERDKRGRETYTYRDTHISTERDRETDRQKETHREDTHRHRIDEMLL